MDAQWKLIRADAAASIEFEGIFCRVMRGEKNQSDNNAPYTPPTRRDATVKLSRVGGVNRIRN